MAHNLVKSWNEKLFYEFMFENVKMQSWKFYSYFKSDQNSLFEQLVGVYYLEMSEPKSIFVCIFNEI